MQYRIFLLLFMILCLSGKAQGLYERFQSAYAEKQFPVCIETGTTLVKYVDHPFLHYQLAGCYAARKADSSLLLLKQLALQGLPYRIEANEHFSSLQTHPYFSSLLKSFAANRKGRHQPVTAFELSHPLLIPEGITANKRGTEFYVGSYAKKSILRRTGGKKEVFIPEGAHGLYGVLGMKLSPDEKELWVCSSSEQQGTAGFAGLFVFDIGTRKLKRKIVLEKQGEPHLLNDLVFDAKGEAYVTDSRAGRLWRVKDTALQRVSSRDFIYPNGIAYNSGKNLLYVADYTGITIVNPVTDSAYALQAESPVYFSSIDGLYFYENSLIGIQNAGDDQYRVVRFQLDKNGEMVTSVKVLSGHHPSFAMPTTGTIVGDEFYFIANSYVTQLQPDGSIRDAEKVQPTLIQKLPLK